ncbi:hypothetical protein [Pantoea anthophila]|uniref:hypothetical protein n=1 Tax=Pantoea anthophila TaxID=470931 RepID=UPI003CFB6FF9
MNQLFGVLPLDGDADEVPGLGAVKGDQESTLNAFKEDDQLHVDKPVTDGYEHYFFPHAKSWIPQAGR